MEEEGVMWWKRNEKFRGRGGSELNLNRLNLK